MIELTRDANRYTEPFAEHSARAGDGEAPFLRTLRENAFDRFTALGFPTTRDEEWRFTNVAPIADTTFRLAPLDDRKDPHRLADGALIDTTWPRLVFVNGLFDPDASSSPAGPADVLVTPIARVLAERPELVEDHLARVARFDEDAFTAWNTAFMNDGACIIVPRGSALSTPIHVVHVARPDAETPVVSHPRNLVVLAPGAEATVIESYLGFGEGTWLTNAVSELVVGDNATLDHYKIQRETEHTYHVGATDLRLGGDATARSHTISLGGSLVRHNITTVLDGEGAHGTLDGLYQIGGNQHVDNHLRVEHVKPNCDSREFFKGILDDKASAVFTGRIVVHPDAQKTDAKQTNMNLMLSPDAQVDTKPQLEIFADDVKCTHGATIGQLEPDALFYLQARGIDDEQANDILVRAFAAEALERIRPPALRERMEHLVAHRLARASGAAHA
jgi:Fe-S cluster assembly protein SufD